MRYSILISTLLLGVASNTAFAGVEAGVGFEHMTTNEYDGADVKANKDSGPRFNFNLGVRQDKAISNLPLFAYKGKFFFGNTTFSDANPSTFSTDSKMMGTSHEIQAIIPYAMYDGQIEYTFGLGYDWWKKKVKDAATTGDWTDDVRGGFVTAGIYYNQPNQPGFHGGLGIKHSFAVREDANIDTLGYKTNPEIDRGSALDFRGELGYRVANSPLDLVTYFETTELPLSESYKLEKANGTTDEYYRHRSKTTVFGLKAMFHFQ